MLIFAYILSVHIHCFTCSIYCETVCVASLKRDELSCWMA